MKITLKINNQDVEAEIKDNEDDHRYWDSGNVFFAKEETGKELAKRQAIQRIKDYIVEHDMEFDQDWNDKSQCKYYPCYHVLGQRIIWASCTVFKYYLPFSYLGSRDHIEQLIKDCQDDLLIIFDKK